MRALLVAVLLLAAGLALPPGAAQPAPEPFLKDAEGDTELRFVGEGTPLQAPFRGGDSDSVDLLAFDLAESDTTVDFVFTLKTLKQTASFTSYEARFGWKGVEYVVAAFLGTTPSLGTRSRAVLYADEDYYQYMGDLEHEVDVEKGTLRVVVEKVFLLGPDDETPGKGDVLKGVHAESRMSLAFLRSGLFGEVVDRVPDGDETKDFAFQIGDVSTGHLKAKAENRVRVSNGGSTTFVYRIELTNKAERGDDVEVSAGPLPEGWNVTVQSPLRLAAQESKVLTVLASVPFGHKHGGFDSFNVTMQSRTDPGSRAVVRLGVLHTPVPQPAGHHSDLYLHTGQSGSLLRFGGNDAGMNTDPSHDHDAPEVPANNGGGDGVSWWIPLNPRLAMGLDFDLERLGALTGSVIGRATGEGVIRAELLYGPANQGPWSREDSILLAESDEQTLALDLQKPTAFSLVMTPLEESDYLPFDPDMSLYLRVELEVPTTRGFCCFDPTSPSLVTQDFKLTLPLHEYHDKLTGVAEAAALLDLVSEGPVEKLGRPGATMTYVFDLKNGGAQPLTVDVDLAGSGVDMGTLVPGGALVLGPKESRKLTLAVAIPPQAQEGQEIEVLLFAHAQEDPSVSAIARTKTTVTLKGEAAADERDVLLAAQSAENDTPGPGVAGLLGALAAALLATRRRRRA